MIGDSVKSSSHKSAARDKGATRIAWAIWIGVLLVCSVLCLGPERRVVLVTAASMPGSAAAVEEDDAVPAEGVAAKAADAKASAESKSSATDAAKKPKGWMERLPRKRSVVPEYYEAAQKWINGDDLYRDGKHGFLYMPIAAVLYVPFAVLPVALGEILWRVVGLGFYVTGLRRVCTLGACSMPRDRGVWGDKFFLLATLLVVVAAAGAVRNGQTNVLLGGLFMHGTAHLVARNWWRSAWALAFAIACKPISLANALVATALHKPLMWRGPLTLLAIVVLGFAHPDINYAIRQHTLGASKVLEAGEPGAGRFQDLTGMLETFGVSVPFMVMTVVRGLAAVGTLALAWIALRRHGRRRGELLGLAIVTSYLMLFNPRTEGVSYLILAPSVALACLDEFCVRKRIWVGCGLFVICFVLSMSHVLTGEKNTWMRALVTCFFCGWLVWTVVVEPRRVRAGGCSKCGYSRRGLPSNAVCPECGATPMTGTMGR